MRRITALAIALVLFMGVLYPSTALALRSNQFVWQEMEELQRTNFSSKRYAEASAGGALVLDTKVLGPHEMSYTFTLPRAEDYDIYVLSTHNSMPRFAKYQWKLDGGEYAYSHDRLHEAYQLYDGRQFTSNMWWYKLDTQNLRVGRHTISFMVDRYTATEQGYYSIFDVLAVVPSAWNWTPDKLNKPFNRNTVKLNYVDGAVLSATAVGEEVVRAEASFKISERSIGIPQLYAEINLNGEALYRIEREPTTPFDSWDPGRVYKERFDLKFPWNAPDAVYEIRTGVMGNTFENGDDYVVIGEVRVGPEKDLTPFTGEAKSLSVSVDGRTMKAQAQIELSRPLPEDSAAYITLWDDDEVLWGALDDPKFIKPAEFNTSGIVTFEAALPENFPEGEYEARIGLHFVNVDNPSPVKVNVEKGSSNKRYKPISYGNLFANGTGKNHFWYVNQADALIWNGKPYIPMGGMVAMNYVQYYDINNDEGNKRRFNNAVADLQTLKAHGAMDCYIMPQSPSAWAPAWAWSYLFQYMEKEGFYYGFQGTNSMTRRLMDAYSVRANPDVPGAQLIGDITESGAVEHTMDGDIISALFVVTDDETGELVQSGKARLTQLAEKKTRLTFDVKLAKEGKYSLRFTPEKAIQWNSAIAFWNEGDYILESIEKFSKALVVGDNFRTVVDPLTNEMFYLIGSERISHPKFNELFADLLEKTYVTVDALNEAWKITPPTETFAEASRLIPLEMTDVGEDNLYFTYFMDPDTEKMYTANAREGVAWMDYADGRDVLFMDFCNAAADAHKKYIDVPIVYKHTGVTRRYYINTNLKGGLDGIGGENYGAIPRAISMAVLANTHADQSARTMWNVVTETNTEEDTGKKRREGPEAWVYPNEEYFIEHMTAMLDYGNKGIYDFLLASGDDKNSDIYIAYSYINNPQMFDYRNSFIEKVLTPERIEQMISEKYNEQIFYSYPPLRDWWYSPTVFSGAQRMDDQYPLRRMVTTDGIQVLNTYDVNWVESDVMFISIINGPSSHMYAQGVQDAVEKEDMRVVMLGYRNDLGAIPAVDKYYTDEKVSVEGVGMVQVLNPPPTAEVLYATEDGKPWAIRDGELWIISAEIFYDVKNQAGDLVADGDYYFLRYVTELGITDTSTINKLK